ncbi:uncharacterized protein A4U43_C03F4530 [Asparagus officinalis]|uniref:RCC1-like domain-containing protein n=1 Tax=Asparagus officinalis TaxID=4686 RepID=A0A5P1FCI5_ASPOF|nr:uncharacterized protein LOC109832923 [Asparagus officinalis]XP_020256007.1 uncharacterized protein LOC109832923 [Asparagus officinalis]XP_020256008.1 uncharacterized protein LOC109832923 [Asparagus officinalis]ONK74270.1 uncharacterized protein A4U43_C03F4530 [Asparagus officinalis]
MEVLISPSSSGKPASSRKSSPSSSTKDLWFVSRQGSIADVESALVLLKKNGGNIDSRNAFGLTPLHIATWRNHVPIVKRLLAAGADPDVRDGESGWSSLHRALHFGHLAVASVLIESGASLILEDSKCRTPVDLLSGPVSQVVGHELDLVATEVFSWGSGTNYQLGTGNAHIQKLPCKLDSLQDSYIKIIAASKFHSAAVSSRGELYTWGFGRGGRLGHPDFDIHSGQAAVITPREVTVGLGSRRVKAIAAAKHHTVIATESGEVFTWGSNREGQLGYTSVDSQATPRRVSSLRSRVIAISAANKHTAAVTESGEVFTWGCNKEGQLGYGTSNSASNYTPRMVEYLKGKVFRGVSAAKYHTVVLGADSEIYTWGHRLVTPRRVVIARSLKKSGNAPLKFHRMERLRVVSVAAGMTHSTALTDDGALFYWVSADPDLRCQQVHSMCGRNIVSISAGKYWTAAVTTTGDVYMWDGKKNKDEAPVATRLHGVKRATSVCVGETHMLVVSALYHPTYLPRLSMSKRKPIAEDNRESEQLDEELPFNDVEEDRSSMIRQNDLTRQSAPSLKSLCEKVAAEFLVEPRNVIQLLEIADSLGADELRKHCEDIVLRNLDFIFTVSAPAIMSASQEILASLEKLLDARSSEPWSYRRLPTSTATFPAVIYSEEEGEDETGGLIPRDNNKPASKNFGDPRADLFLQGENGADQAVSKQVRALRKKLQQIEMLETKQLNGHALDDQQIAKLQTRFSIETALAELGFPLEGHTKLASLALPDSKGNKKVEVSKKLRRSKQKDSAQAETLSKNNDLFVKVDTLKGFPDDKNLQISEVKKDVDTKLSIASKIIDDCSPCSHSPRGDSNSKKNKASHLFPTKKKNNKKGGLSLFLSGALDDTPTPKPAPPPTPKNEGPAWHGAKITKGPVSLREIQNEQSKINDMSGSRTKERLEDQVELVGAGHVKLSSFMPGPPSSPIAVVPPRAMPSSEGEKSTPPWSSAGSSPVQHRPSLRDIQIQQGKKQLNISHSPKVRTSGFSIASSHSSPSESSSTPPSRWFKPEIDAPSSIRSIQIEEAAMKDLKRFYTNVKLVKAKP